MELKVFYFNAYRECTYLLYDEQGHTLIIDAGMSNEREQQRFTEFITAQRLTPVALLITHTHPDHVCGVPFVEQTYRLSAIVQPAEGQLSIPQLPDLKLFAIATPGHKEDSVCYYMPDLHILFTGDTLFQESIGRTDLPGGDMPTLIRSLGKLAILPDDTDVYPGHGYPTTIAHEKQYNPYMGTISKS